MKKKMPKVINLKHTEYKLPPNTKYIGRMMPKYKLGGSPFANPYRIGDDSPDGTTITRKLSLELYVKRLERFPRLTEMAKRELRGLDLACWCAPEACHGDILLKIANEE